MRVALHRTFTMLVLMTVPISARAEAVFCTDKQDVSASDCEPVTEFVALCDVPSTWQRHEAEGDKQAILSTVIPNTNIFIEEGAVRQRAGSSDIEIALKAQADFAASHRPDALEIFRLETDARSDCTYGVVEFDIMLPMQVTEHDSIDIKHHMQVMMFGFDDRIVVVTVFADDVVWRRPGVPFRRLVDQLATSLRFGSAS